MSAQPLLLRTYVTVALQHGAILVTLLIWEKFLQILHFGSLLSVLSSGVGEDLGGKLKNVLYPLVMHASLTWCCNSSNIKPAPVCAFCARVIGDTRLVSIV